MEEVTRALTAQEASMNRRRALLERYHAPVIAFCMGVPGGDTPLLRRAFLVGRDRLRAALDAACVKVLRKEETLSETGCEYLCAVKADALTVKELCVQIEDADALSRLFDLEVLSPEDETPAREAVDGSALRDSAAARRVMADYFAEADRRDVSEKVTRALLDTLYTTPKPGLVDRYNNGGRKNMTLATFEASTKALRPFWGRCMEIGQQTAEEPPGETFARLREPGMAAERDMYAATGGVNTHKGAIFILGVICGALGRLWRPEAPCRDVNVITRTCADMTRSAMDADFAALRPETARTTGERLYLAHGLKGIRGEMANGLLSVKNVALPMIREAIEAGYNINRAGVYALLALIARGRDTTMIAQGGKERAGAASKWAEELLYRCDYPPLTAVEVLNRKFVAENLSPGGCADLLAAALFLYSL